AHGEDALRLDSYEKASADRGGYRTIDTARPSDSELLKRIHSADDPMPPEDAEKQLTDVEKDILTRWVKQGGKYTKHWAFVVPQKSKPPHDGNAIDAFVQRKLKASGRNFAADADRATLARRVALTLTGLPPEPEQLDRFLAGVGEEAYRALVTELLDSPRFGEHQARYWLDAVRYGDTHGLHLDNKRGIYPYRDWVVRALNNDMPLDEFIVKQLAGDLLPDPSFEDLVATGYVRLNPTTGEGGAIPAEFQMKNNFDRVETLGTVFLGMSLNCARCHTHKYDPIPQTEYYQLLAFFNSTAEPSMDRNAYEYGPTVRVPRDPSQWDRFPSIQADVEQFVADAREAAKAQGVKQNLPVEPFTALSKIADPKSPFAKLAVFASATELQKRVTDGITTSLVAKDLAKPRETRILNRGEYDQPKGELLQPDVLQVMGGLTKDAPRNRLGLAKWLTSRNHPLVSRVLVNRIWQRVFGDGLVRTPEDFGLQGEQSTHPELLDWLAVELQDREWSLKSTLRLMVSSRTFRQSSAFQPDDPENRLFGRGPSYRLDAEVLRDLGLWSSQLLDPHMGGEGVKPYQPVGMWKALAHPASNTKQYQQDKGALLYRRSLYVYWKRTSPHPMMTLFDAPDRESSCVRRSRTNTSVQSLGLLNETQRVEMARKFAERLMMQSNEPEERIELAFKLVACREPNQQERSACLSLIEEMRKRYGQSSDDAIALLSYGEAGRDESIDASELAAMTQVCVTILASDAAILMY
ncbi:MAG: PSD1 and planctomycete cytochrome C domain-containing protein, partial [Planctomycetaceae bacterium]